MSLSLSTKVDIRRHLGVPAAGYPTSGVTGGIRVMQTSGQLETYMTSLQAEEESILTGFPFGSVRIYGNPQPGNTVTLTINGSVVTYTVSSADFGPTNSPLYSSPIAPLQSVAYNLATAVNGANIGPLAAGGMNYGATPPITLPDGANVTLSSPTTFTLTASATGLAVVVIANGATYPSPSLSIKNLDGTPGELYGWVPICNFLESQVISPNLSLRYEQADVVRFRGDETAARLQTYRWACLRMGQFLSVGMEAGMLKRVGSNSALRITV